METQNLVKELDWKRMLATVPKYYHGLDIYQDSGINHITKAGVNLLSEYI